MNINQHLDGDSRLPDSNQPGANPDLTPSIHQDAAFYHESAAFHHRQAAHHLGTGDRAIAERHIWAAFGHSLNAHESTRGSVSALRKDEMVPYGDAIPAESKNGSPPPSDRN